MKNTEKVIETKNTDSAVADIDDAKRSVKIAIASMGDLDRDNDIFDKSAFNRTIKQRGPSGTNEIWHLLDHGYGIASAALSKPKELFVEGDKLMMVSEYRDTWNWKEIAWPLYVAGDINQHSVGFSTINSNMIKDNGKDVRLITEVALWEGSAVLWGANANTPTIGVVKSFLAERKRKSEQNIGERLQSVYRAISEKGINDDNLSLLNIEFKFIEQFCIDLQEKEALHTAENATELAQKEEEQKRINEVLTSIQSLKNNSLFTKK